MKDSERFRKFTVGKFNDDTIRFLQDKEAKFIWSIHKAQINSGIWKQIRSGDYVFFSQPKDNFRLVGKLTGKIINGNLGKIMWPDSLDKNEISHFLLFSHLEKTNIAFSQIIDNAESKISVPVPGLYKLGKKIRFSLTKVKDTKPGDKKQPKKPKPFTLHSTNGPPEKNKSEVYRFIRDSNLVRKLKDLYDNRCQVCGYTFEYDKGKFYSEVHHYNPLEEDGPDDISNMIVVCSNHHAEFDYKMMAIDIDERSLINKKGNKVGEITFHKNHRLDKKNILSQMING
jgi:hypothetical protein